MIDNKGPAINNIRFLLEDLLFAIFTYDPKTFYRKIAITLVTFDANEL